MLEILRKEAFSDLKQIEYDIRNEDDCEEHSYSNV
jgi:hypothetical protein